MGAHPGGCYTGDLPVDGYGEDYDFWVEARAATRATTTTSGSSAGCSTSRRRSSGSTGSAPSASPRCAPRPRPTRGTPTSATHVARPRRAGRTRGSAPRCGARATSRSGSPRLGADAVLAGAGVANLVGLARRAARARARAATCSSPPRSGCGATTPTPADPFVLNHRNFPTATMLSDAQIGARRARRRRGHDDDRLSRRRADRPQRERELHVDSARTRSSSAPVAATTSRAPPPSASSSRRSRRHALPSGAATSPRPAARCARSSPTSASSRSSDDELVLTAVPAGAEPLARPDRSGTRGLRLGSHGRATTIAELPPPTRRRESRRCGDGTPAAGSSARSLRPAWLASSSTA